MAVLRKRHGIMRIESRSPDTASNAAIGRDSGRSPGPVAIQSANVDRAIPCEVITSTKINSGFMLQILFSTDWVSHRSDTS